MAAPSRAPFKTLEAGPGEPGHSVWDELRRRVATVVRECNCEAGEAIWGFAEDAGRLRVFDRTENRISLELTLDAARTRLWCDLGTLRRKERWVFHISQDGARLRRAAETYSVHEAVDLMLDRLVCA